MIRPDYLRDRQFKKHIDDGDRVLNIVECRNPMCGKPDRMDHITRRIDETNFRRGCKYCGQSWLGFREPILSFERIGPMIRAGAFRTYETVA